MYPACHGSGIYLFDKQEGEDDNSDDDNSEEDIDDTMAAVSISQGNTRHKLQFLIRDKILPYNMTVYQVCLKSYFIKSLCTSICKTSYLVA